MTGKIYFILVSSLVMGILSGVFLYVTVFIPELAPDEDQSEIISEDTVVIEGRMYGGCQEMDSCASFKLQDNRRYQYKATPQAEVSEGKISEDIRDAVFNTVDTKTLVTLSEDTTPHQCAGYVDGLDYMYDVTKEGKIYPLDTCTTKLATNSALQKNLISVWEFMANPTTTYPTLIEEGPIQMIFDRFNEGGTQAE
jgi:hypothetical protein